ncbi:MAG: hypothetical protein ABSE56_17245 [Bryobacteraceae bacterium]|jgi:hypothetical protein
MAGKAPNSEKADPLKPVFRLPEGLDAVTLRAQLDRILSSAHFKNSKRCQSLLTYVVEAVIEGHPDRVKERTIGVEVFGRDPAYDTNEDAVVRTAAAEVRKRLAQYYMEPQRDGEVRIDLPLGSYLPEFRSEASPERPEAPSRKRWSVVAAAVVVAAAGIWLWQGSTETDLERFWAPLIQDHEVVQICVGQPIRLYKFAGSRRSELDGKMVEVPDAPGRAEMLRSTSLTLEDLGMVGEHFFSRGAALAMVNLVALIHSKGRPYRLRSGASVPYAELRGSPAILVGAYNNDWTMRLTSGLRFYFEREGSAQTTTVRDRQHPGDSRWMIPYPPRQWDIPEDYAIIARVLDPATERTVVSMGGVEEYGTLAASEFVTNPSYLSEAFRGAPKGWYRKNIQVVLRTRIVGGTPGPPQVVATHFW